MHPRISRVQPRGRIIYSAAVSRKSHYAVDSSYFSAGLVRRVYAGRGSRDRGSDIIPGARQVVGYTLVDSRVSSIRSIDNNARAAIKSSQFGTRCFLLSLPPPSPPAPSSFALSIPINDNRETAESRGGKKRTELKVGVIFPTYIDFDISVIR